MEEKYHPIAYESGRGMSLGEIPGVAQKKKRILGMIFLENSPRGAFLVTYPTLNSHNSWTVGPTAPNQWEKFAEKNHFEPRK